MNRREMAIVNIFIDRYSGGEAGRNSLRLRATSIFPDFDKVSPDEKESCLEAAEVLERQGLLSLNWEKRRKKERLKTLFCPDMEALFRAAGRKNPKIATGEIRLMLDGKKERHPLAGHLAENFGTADFERGIDMRAADDLISLLDFLSGTKESGVTTRALSVMLFRNSKRLEQLLVVWKPVFSRLRKEGIAVPDFSALERSFPEVWITGKLVFEYGNELGPVSNLCGMVGLPLSAVRNMTGIRTIDGQSAPSVLTIENKETFFAPGPAGQRFDCLLYSGGYPNQAVAAVIRLLAASGFTFYHAGDLDPEGVLIMQKIMDIAKKPVTPLGMNTAVFERYFSWSRPLQETMLSRTEQISAETRALPGIAELLCRIEETRLGVEQEIIDYSIYKEQ